jgi:hypothetical protein
LSDIGSADDDSLPLKRIIFVTDPSFGFLARARSAQIGGPEGISNAFQISTYSGEPLTSKIARNLFSKDNWRAALGDKVVKSGPEVSFVGMAFALSRARKRLTRAAAGPDGSFIVPSGKPEGVCPSADAGEEVTLRVRFEVIGAHLEDRSRVDVARRNAAEFDQIAKPLRGMRVDLVVIGWHSLCSPNAADDRRVPRIGDRHTPRKALRVFKRAALGQADDEALNAGLRFEIERVLHFIEARCEAVQRLIGADEDEEIALALGEADDGR